MYILDTYTINNLLCTALIVFLLGMGKGGVPVGSIALPLLILIWPGKIEPAKNAVAFLLPLLCLMDVCAVAFYKKHILWKTILPLLPGTALGVTVAGLLFLSKEDSILNIQDDSIKLIIGIIGLVFVLYQAIRNWILRIMASSSDPGIIASSIFGFVSGVVSTVAHAAGPVMQMYLLPRKLPKMNYAATTAGYFLILNLAKIIPFATAGILDRANLILGAYMLPVIPIGVAAGYFMVKKIKHAIYIGFIYSVLFFTSITLIWTSLR